MMLSGGSRIKRAPVVRRNRLPMILIIGGGILLVLIAGFFAWKYFDSKNADDDAAAGQKIIEKVGNLYLTPEGEQPTVAQIKDKDKLKDQQFFSKADNGDYLLIFTESQFAVIYREEVNKIVNVGPISTEGQGEVGGASTDVPQESP